MSFGMGSPTGLKAGSTATGGMGSGGLSGNKIPKGYQQGQLQQFTPEQMQLFQQMFGSVGPESNTARLAAGDEGLFNEMEAPALRQFSGLQGQLASRFSQGGGGPGSMSSRRSSGFQNASGQLASDFAQDLQSRRQELMRQATQDLHGMSSSLLGQRPYEQFLVDKPQNPWIDIARKFGGEVPGLIAQYASGGFG